MATVSLGFLAQLILPVLRRFQIDSNYCTGELLRVCFDPSELHR